MKYVLKLCMSFVFISMPAISEAADKGSKCPALPTGYEAAAAHGITLLGTAALVVAYRTVEQNKILTTENQALRQQPGVEQLGMAANQVFRGAADWNQAEEAITPAEKSAVQERFVTTKETGNDSDTAGG